MTTSWMAPILTGKSHPLPMYWSCFLSTVESESESSYKVWTPSETHSGSFNRWLLQMSLKFTMATQATLSDLDKSHKGKCTSLSCTISNVSSIQNQRDFDHRDHPATGKIMHHGACNGRYAKISKRIYILTCIACPSFAIR